MTIEPGKLVRTLRAKREVGRGRIGVVVEPDAACPYAGMAWRVRFDEREPPVLCWSWDLAPVLEGEAR